jgi:hypothetical protein
MDTVRRMPKAFLFALSIGLSGASLGCSIRGVVTSVPPRIFREVHGLRVRSYEITPAADDLSVFKAVEVHPLENLMLDQVPEPMVKRLNTGIAERIRSLGHFDRVTPVDEEMRLPGTGFSQSHAGVGLDRSKAELVVEGYIDDYTPGVPKLRYIEQGNNHAVLTVRIMLKDKRTAIALGTTNITVENTRVTSNVERMVDKTAKEVAMYVDRSTTRYKSKEAREYVNW